MRDEDDLRQHAEVFLVFAHDTGNGQDHLLNVLGSLEVARAECREWQTRHRQWWNGINRYNLFVRIGHLGKRGVDALSSAKEHVVSADFE